MGSATAITPSAILLVGKEKMVKLLHKQHAMSDRFIAHLLSRIVRLEGDLVERILASNDQQRTR